MTTERGATLPKLEPSPASNRPQQVILDFTSILKNGFTGKDTGMSRKKEWNLGAKWI